MTASTLWAETTATLATEYARTGLGANDLGDIAWDGSSIWAAGSGTLSTKLWGDGRKATDWVTYSAQPGFGRGSMSSLFAQGPFLMMAWQYSGTFRNGTDAYGDGFSISYNGGNNWYHISVTDIFPDRASYTYPGWYTITYDIAVSNGTIWCSSTSGFLVKSQDSGVTWENILPDGDQVNLLNNNHHGQCVTAYGDTVWVGTWQGMNLSVDSGENWQNFSWPLDSEPTSIQPGNFCYAVEEKVVDGATHIWVGSSPYVGKGQYGICHTADNGATWQYKTTKYNAWNFAFGHNGASDPRVSDRTVFAASDSGLVVTYDLGDTWNVVTIAEPDSISSGSTGSVPYTGRQWDPGTMTYGVVAADDSLWVTSSDGIAMSPDWGQTWSIFKGVTRVKTLDTGDRNVGTSSLFSNVDTYAFPNPFSPMRQTPDYARTRIQYALSNDARISISIHAFNGKKIREIMTNKFRSGGRDYQEIWDGRDDTGQIVPNGVYFYDIESDKGDIARGKIMVVD